MSTGGDLADVKAQIVGHQRALVALLTKQVVKTADAIAGPWPASWPGAWSSPESGCSAGWESRSLPRTALFRMWMHCWLGLLAYPRARALARRRIAGAHS